MDRGAWWTTVYGVAKSWTRLTDYTAAARETGGTRDPAQRVSAKQRLEERCSSPLLTDHFLLLSMLSPCFTT